MATQRHEDEERNQSAREYWETDGFAFLKHPSPSLLSCLIRTPGSSARPTPVQRRVLAQKKLEALFKSLCRHTHCHHEDDIFQHVNGDVKLGINNCKVLERLYVAARRRCMDDNCGGASFRSRLTQRVDQWIEILDQTATSEPGKSPTTGPLEEAEHYTIEDLVLRPKGVEADINALLNPDSDNKQDRDSGMDIDMDTDVDPDLKLEDSGISDAASQSSRYTLL